MARSENPDRRKHARHPLATTVQFYHGPSRREYPARSVDVSHGGMLMYLPASVPVARGHAIRVTIGSHARPELAELSNRPLDATVVRVDRRKVVNLGHLPVGIRFALPQG